MPVAVVMPTRDQRSFIGAAVDSVLTQAQGRVRLCIQDGGSTDGTLEWLTHRAEGEPAIDWRSEPDGGPAEALNRGFRRALADPSTRILGWLNSDDLLTEGALDRVLRHFDAHPDHVAVYGEGLHVDERGREVGLYPTRDPSTPLSAWADACPVCQPTMWLRREAVEALAPLDETLQAAFDFDWWLRLWRRFPGRIGKLDEVQACSRLHADTITARQRQRVALEAVRVIHRHLGPAPAHWILTCADELRATYPDGAGLPLRERLQRLLEDARPYLSDEACRDIARRWGNDVALRLALPEAFLHVHADGWLGARTMLRVHVREAGVVTLSGTNAGPVRLPLTLEAQGPMGQRVRVTVAPGGDFVLRLATPPSAGAPWWIVASRTFIPRECEPGSGDDRALSCRVLDMRWSPLSAPARDNAGS